MSERDDRDIDWTLTTWEGSRRDQLRRAQDLTLRERLQAVEDMAELSQRLRKARQVPPDRAADRPERGGGIGAVPQQLDTALLGEIVRRVVEVARPDRIVLFGSAARGEMGPDSDVDLLVIKSGVEHRRRLAQRIYRGLIGVGVPVDIVVAAPEDIERFGQRVGSILRPALRAGREIYAA